MLTLIDGNSLLFRAYYGVRARLARSDGTPTGAVYGFPDSSDMLLGVFETFMLSKNKKNAIKSTGVSTSLPLAREGQDSVLPIPPFPLNNIAHGFNRGQFAYVGMGKPF